MSWSFSSKRDWEAEKWIDYKNELFPTACDLPVSVGLCYHKRNSLSAMRIKIAELNVTDANGNERKNIFSRK